RLRTVATHKAWLRRMMVLSVFTVRSSPGRLNAARSDTNPNTSPQRERGAFPSFPRLRFGLVGRRTQARSASEGNCRRANTSPKRERGTFWRFGLVSGPAGLIVSADVIAEQEPRRVAELDAKGDGRAGGQRVAREVDDEEGRTVRGVA